MCNFYNGPKRGSSVSYENGEDTTAKGELVRTRTLKFLPGITVYEIGTFVPNHTRCTLLSSKEHIIKPIQGLLYVVCKHKIWLG